MIKLANLTLATMAFGMLSPSAATALDKVDCTRALCGPNEPATLKVQSVGDTVSFAPGTTAQSSASALQPDRRVDIRGFAPAEPAPGYGAFAGRFSIDLSGGGRIWVVEDPNPGVPELAISATGLVPYDGTEITQPVNFMIRTNYPSFIERMELRVFRGTDIDLVRPLAVLPVETAAVTQVVWDGQIDSGRPLQVGDDLIYVLRAYGANGSWDETYRSRMSIVRPDDVQRQNFALRSTYERATGITASVEEAVGRSLLQSVFSSNGLRLQNIPINASRVRIVGADVPSDRQVQINGDMYPVDLQGRLAAEFLMPMGRHAFDVKVAGNATAPEMDYTLEVDLAGRYSFAVAIADVTLYQNRVTPSGQASLAQREDDILSDGRLALYAKQRFRERYLLTAQMDTTERELRHLFDGFGKAYPEDIFRRLDPDMYYPTYGDDSQTYRDADTMGRFYLRLNWDKNEALWGNYQTGFDGTEFAQYNRSLYGAAAHWRSEQANSWGEAVTQAKVFASEAQSLPGRNELLGTGGSLYYLKNTDLLPGSEQVRVEVVDPVSGLIDARVELMRGVDYEIDYYQGRIILARPLSQIARGGAISITRNTAMEGLTQKLVVEYEWIPSGFEARGTSWGIRGKHWFKDALGVGVTYVDENRAGQDYTLHGADITLRAGEGTYLKAEYAQSESLIAPTYFSDNGGLLFKSLGVTTDQRGEAKSVEGRVNFGELGLTALDWTAGAWWRQTQNGFSSSLYSSGVPLEQYGAEVLGEIRENLELYIRAARNKLGVEQLDQAQALLDWQINPDSNLTTEIRSVDEKSSYNDANGLLGAVRYTRRLMPGLEMFGQVQLTLDDDGGAYAKNDRYMVGGHYSFGNRSSIGAEISTGDRGPASTVNAEYLLGSDRRIYASYTGFSDEVDYHPVLNPATDNGWTIGQRSQVSSRLSLFNESQYLKEPQQSGLAHTVGLDFFPGRGWSTGLTVQDGRLTRQDGEKVDRFAVSGRVGRTSPETDWQSKLEWRRDTGFERREQWLTTNRVTHKIDDNWRVAGRFNYSDTKDHLDRTKGARFVESNVGFAYRPWDNSRWGVFGRYTYLYDQASSAQFGYAGAQQDQISHIASVEGVYQIDQRWEVSTKVATRHGKVRMQRGEGRWFNSDATLVAGQLRYDLMNKWHVLGEVRSLSVRDGGTRTGAMVGVDRDVSSNFRIGAGYNFAKFSDDLTNFDSNNRGWFINLVGYY